ncbi:MAG: hypothetical protein HY876_05195 [Coriobacteriales bacterium]|nr:hypothetical protein [Coriobacteriales bacterium]
MSEDGVDFAGNREGYLTLARWFLIMAHPEMEDHSDPDWYLAGYHLDDAFSTSDSATVTVVLEGRGKLATSGLDAHAFRMYRMREPGHLLPTRGRGGFASFTESDDC